MCVRVQLRDELGVHVGIISMYRVCKYGGCPYKRGVFVYSCSGASCMGKEGAERVMYVEQQT